ncbi:MAG: type I DNA topoisomerase, partial [Chloroflexota bacterium]
MMKENLVIVESPAKAKTLGKILKGYKFEASLGHIRDLPKNRLGVDTDNGFAPKYVVPRDKGKTVKALKEAVEAAKTVYLATDPDREGEAIAWHIYQVTRTDHKTYRRVVFHELTEEAVTQAFKHPRTIDNQLVNAQQARRILDRLVGYKLSPLLWRKVRRGLSAGRVQSVALRIVVDREREIEQFVPVEYWSIEAELAKAAAADGTFRAALVGYASGGKLELHRQAETEELVKELESAVYKVLKVKTKPLTRQPAPPFITSTLQQEAWRQLRFTAKQTMAVAQQLYEGLPVGEEGSVGLITYMRTDSTRVARSAIAETREFIASRYGPKLLPPHARAFTRVVKGAQEAHEAIRPTRIHREPSVVKPYLNGNQFRLYELIWKRMVASQMAAAVFDNTTVDIEARQRGAYLFRTSTSVNRDPGFTVLYSEGKDEADRENGDVSALPPLEKDDELNLLGLFPEQHFTQPPSRYTEASLIKTLEQWGIGRPSTYAPTLSVIQDRDYVSKQGGSFHPT